ncbi:hypothetical protein AVEN_133262-1 [Araneus ventricosus]|uniref:Uncharacterized protein n=1 Tax=Araneus ventricosus TaxID=182803 RepID=A0A4Y2DME7_ARAVE|nr:hypothetical protein AVEN_133262-1 [Araneus ventricosus]
MLVDLVHVKSDMGQTTHRPLVWFGSMEKQVPVQVVFSSSDRGRRRWRLGVQKQNRFKHLTDGLVRKRGEGVSAQVSSSSFDHSLNFEVYPTIALELLQNGT